MSSLVLALTQDRACSYVARLFPFGRVVARIKAAVAASVTKAAAKISPAKESKTICTLFASLERIHKLNRGAGQSLRMQKQRTFSKPLIYLSQTGRLRQR
jgi:hypothetical protein